MNRLHLWLTQNYLKPHTMEACSNQRSLLIMIQIAKVFPEKKKKSHLVQETRILQNDWRNWKNEG